MQKLRPPSTDAKAASFPASFLGDHVIASIQTFLHGHCAGGVGALDGVGERRLMRRGDGDQVPRLDQAHLNILGVEFHRD